MICGACRTDTVLANKRLRLEPEGEEPILVDRAEVYECPQCGWICPTEATRRRLFQCLGVHPENRLDRSVKVKMAEPE